MPHDWSAYGGWERAAEIKLDAPSLLVALPVESTGSECRRRVSYQSRLGTSPGRDPVTRRAVARPLVVILAERATDIDLVFGKPALVVPPDAARVALVGLNNLSLPSRHRRPRSRSSRRSSPPLLISEIQKSRKGFVQVVEGICGLAPAPEAAGPEKRSYTQSTRPRRIQKWLSHSVTSTEGKTLRVPSSW